MTTEHRFSQFFPFSSRSLRVLLSVLAILVSVFSAPTATVSAQTAESPFEIIPGAVIAWTDPWRVDYDQYGSIGLFDNELGEVHVLAANMSPDDSGVKEFEEGLMTLTRLPEGGFEEVASGFDAAGGYYFMGEAMQYEWMEGPDVHVLNYSRGWFDEAIGLTIIVLVQVPVERFQHVLTSIPQTVTLNDIPLFGDLDFEEVVTTFEAGAGFDIPSPEGDNQPLAQDSTPSGDEPSGNAEAGNDFESVNGTVFAYPADWSADPAMSSPDGIQLQAGDATLILGDMAEDQDGEALFNELSSTLPQIVDQGPTPDGGYYGLAYGQDNGGRDFYILFRFLHAAGTGTPVVVMLAAPTDAFEQALTLAHGVTANGQPVLEGLDDAVTLATLQNGGPTGAPVFTGGEPSAPVATEESSPSAVGTEIEAPSGTLISWTDAWTYEALEGMPASFVVLYGVDLSASLMISEGGAGQSVDEVWESFSSTGGDVLDEGETPDGGYYQISFTESSSSPVGATSGPTYTFARIYATDSVPILFILSISGENFDASLAAARDVTTNGVSLMEGVNDAALIATFENGGPTGEAIFAGGEPSATGGGAEEPGNSANESRRDITGAGIERGPSGLPELPGASQESDASYTSEMLGYTLAWDDSWTPNESNSEVNEDDGYDFFVLESGGSGGAWFTLVGMEWGASDDAGDIIESWTTDGFIEEVFAEGTEVVLVDSRRNSGAVVYVGPASEDDPELWVTVFELVNVDDELRLEPTLLVPLSDFEEVYEDATESITVDGDEVFGYFSTEEIMEVLPEE